MGWLPVLLGIISCIVYLNQKSFILLIISALGTIIIFWSWGIMHNIAFEKAKQRKGFTGRFFDINKEESLSVPDWIANINMISSIIIFVFFVIAMIKLF